MYFINNNNNNVLLRQWSTNITKHVVRMTVALANSTTLIVLIILTSLQSSRNVMLSDRL